MRHEIRDYDDAYILFCCVSSSFIVIQRMMFVQIETVRSHPTGTCIYLMSVNKGVYHADAR